MPVMEKIAKFWDKIKSLRTNKMVKYPNYLKQKELKRSVIFLPLPLSSRFTFSYILSLGCSLNLYSIVIENFENRIL